MLYDTHCHPNNTKQKDINQILETFKNENNEGFLNAVWTNFDTIKDCINLAKNNNFIFASIWIHPSDININLVLETEIKKLEKIYIENSEYIIWIWECWLDYFHLNENIEIREKQILMQKKYFIAQINLAKKYNLPLIIHNRESKDDIYDILIEQNYKNFVFHCCTENLEYVNKLLNFSPKAMISFSWIVTFSNAKEVQNTAKNIPIENILIETDSPLLTPTPFRWKYENEPSYTKYVLEYICKLRKEDCLLIEKQIFSNSINFFNINKKLNKITS